MKRFLPASAAFAAALFSGVLIGCAAPAPRAHASNQPPEWLDRPGSAAPAGWWVALGAGPTRAEAEDAARARLAQRVDAHVRAVETSRTTEAGGSLESRVVIRTDVRLPGVQILRTATDPGGGGVALAGLDPLAAGRAIAGRVEARLLADPPKVAPDLAGQIEQGAALAPDAADWAGMRALLEIATRALPPGRLEAPEPVADALRDAFGAGATGATWRLRPVRSYMAGERLAAWRLEAVVAGEPRRWTGVVRSANASEAARLAEIAAVRRVRDGAGPMP